MDLIRSSVQRAMTLQLRINECQRILDYAQQYADERWVDRDKKSFMDWEKSVGSPHIVNSSTALAVIYECPAVFDQTKLSAYNGVRLADVCRFYVENYKTDREPNYWPSKDTHTWSPYVTALALKAIGLSAKANIKEESLTEIAKSEKSIPEILKVQIHQLQEFLKHWAGQDLERQYTDYDQTFFAYTALSASEVIFDAVRNLGDEFVSVTDLANRNKVAQSVLSRLRLDFYSHMTFKLAGVSQHLDIVSLALSMFCLAGQSKEYQIPDDVLDAALDTVFSLQLPSGFWDTSTPLLGAATGRVGCSSIELANCLLKIPRTMRKFEQYFGNFDRLLTQLSRGFDFAHPERGWPTDLRRNGNSYQTWYSFLVFQYLYLLAERTREYAAEILLQDFRYRKSKPKLTWEMIGDYDGFKQRVEKAFIEPMSNHALSRQYSMILFGPPGTGKTSIAQALAYKLESGFVEIGPSDFLGNGIEGIFAQGDLIFQRLLLLDQVVVLFDEIDELVSIRNEGADKLSKFLTTYMLPWLQRLRDKASLIFIFATNYIDRFDPAIRRYGRFDLVVPIGPPQGDERKKILKAMKGKLNIEDKDIDGVIDKIPPQATVGDIVSAVNRAKGLKGFDPAIFLAQMAPDKLLINADDWDEFLKQSKSYSQ
jgi:ATPase family protein associated with various cellular activities (AAA)